MTTRKSKGSALRPDLQNLAVDPAKSAGESSLRMTAAPVIKKPKGRTYRTEQEHSSGKTEQEQFNEMMVSRKIKLAPAKQMKELLQGAKNESYDPIESAMKDNPTLTRELAEEMAKAFGF
jgi:hypothetical protein